MSDDMTPAQRLAISRARLADALRDPVWLILLRRWSAAATPPNTDQQLPQAEPAKPSTRA